MKSIRRPSLENKGNYTRYRNRLKSLLVKADKQHYSSLMVRYKNNLRKSWQVIKEVLNKNVLLNENDQFQINDEILKNPEQIAEAFNTYFVNVGPNLAQQIPLSSFDPTTNIVTNQYSIFIEPTDNQEVVSLVKMLKNSSAGWDEISPKVVRSSIESFITPLTHVLNRSIVSGIVPKELKIAKVIPIFKSGDKMSINNYRPVSVLPCFSKILEKIVHSRITKFIEKHKLLYKHQFGFRKNHNTAHAIITLVNEITSSLDKGESCLGVFLDLKKAFDTVDHNILLRKLEKYGIRGIPLKWLENYLAQRTQCVRILNRDSSFQYITCGVPQGSVLGPLLFLLYINDIDKVGNNLFSVLFADDTNLFMSCKNINVLYSSMNIVLDKVLVWLNSNKLSLNILKTHYMLFTTKKNTDIPSLSLQLNESEIERVQKTKFLGVMIDEKLQWSGHIDYIKKKISKNIGIIYKARNYFDCSTLVTLYYTFIYPYLTYCIEVWGSSSLARIGTLLKLQKRFCRIITFSNPITHSLPLFKSLHILTVSDIYLTSIALFMYRFHHNSLPLMFNNYFVINIPSGIITRSIEEYKVPFCRLSIRQKTIVYQGPTLWNAFPIHLKSINSIHVFKKTLKHYYISKY
jgi:hypothetical protein